MILNNKLTALYNLFRYDILRFFKNLYVFRKTLWNARSYDYSGVLYALKDQLTQMEPVIRNGHHVHGQRTADKIKLCMLLIDRVLENDCDSFDDIEIDWSSKRLTLIRTPKYSEAPRNSRYTALKIMQSKENLPFVLLMNTLTKYLRHMWD